MKRDPSFKLIKVFAIITVNFGLIYFLLFPLFSDYFKKVPQQERTELKIDKEFFQKLDNLKDNTVDINQPINPYYNIFNPL